MPNPGVDPADDESTKPPRGSSSPCGRSIGADISRDGNYLLVARYHGWSSAELFLRDLRHLPKGKADAPTSSKDFVPLAVGKSAHYSAEVYKDQIYLLTDEDARELLVLLGGPSGLIARSVHRYPAPSGARTFGHAITLVTKPAKLLVVGAEQTSVKGGSLAVYPLASDGLPSGTPFWINQNSAGVPGTAESGDEFGFSLAAEGSTLVVGVPGEDIGKVKDAGNIVVLTYTGGTSFSGVGIGQNSSGVADKAENNDQFGHAVAIGNGYLAVGVPGESSGAGMVQVFTAAAKPTPKYTIDQNSKGVPGGNERGDLFGASVVVQF